MLVSTLRVQRVALGTHPSLENLRRKAPLLIFLAIAIALVVYVAFEILIETMINSSWTNGPLISTIMHFTKNVTQTISSWGYIGIFGLMVLEASSLPIPSEIILPFSGYLVSRELLNFWATILVATLGAIVGSFVAGAVRMPLAKFAAYTITGCVIWNTLLIYVGYYLGNNWAQVADIAHYL